MCGSVSMASVTLLSTRGACRGSTTRADTGGEQDRSEDVQGGDEVVVVVLVPGGLKGGARGSRGEIVRGERERDE